MTLDLSKLALTPEEIAIINARHGNLVGGLRASNDTARAQRAKLLDGIVAWLRAEEQAAHANVLPGTAYRFEYLRCSLEQAARAAGYEWPVKEGQ